MKYFAHIIKPTFFYMDNVTGEEIHYENETQKMLGSFNDTHSFVEVQAKLGTVSAKTMKELNAQLEKYAEEFGWDIKIHLFKK